MVKWWATKEEYPKRLQYYKRRGYKIVGDRIVDVGRPKHHYLKLKILQKGKHRVSVGKLVHVRSHYRERRPVRSYVRRNPYMVIVPTPKKGWSTFEIREFKKKEQAEQHARKKGVRTLVEV